jgi:hypothetical protein
MTELRSYQTRLDRASDIRPGDFLDVVEPNRDIRGPRGGRYRYDGLRVESRVVRVAWLVRDRVGGRVEELPADDGWRAARPDGFRIVVRGISKERTVDLPGNLADLVSAVVRRD